MRSSSYDSRFEVGNIFRDFVEHDVSANCKCCLYSYSYPEISRTATEEDTTTRFRGRGQALPTRRNCHSKFSIVAPQRTISISDRTPSLLNNFIAKRRDVQKGLQEFIGKAGFGSARVEIELCVTTPHVSEKVNASKCSGVYFNE